MSTHIYKKTTTSGPHLASLIAGIIQVQSFAALTLASHQCHTNRTTSGTLPVCSFITKIVALSKERLQLLYLFILVPVYKNILLCGSTSQSLSPFECLFSPSGAVLGFMLGVFQIPLSECDDLYRKLGSDVFKQNVIVGTVKMGWNHAFYDSEAWENILRSVILSAMDDGGCD